MKIECHGICYRYPHAQCDALHDIDFCAEPGISTAVIGRNGCGKSTLLSVLVGILRPQHGVLSYDGRPSSTLSRADFAASVAFLPQYERFSFAFTVWEYVMLGRVPNVGLLGVPGSDDERKTFEAIEYLGLTSLIDRNVSELSGGELQLVRIARCLAQETQAIVLDEPTSMLDPANAVKVADALCDLSERGKTLLFTTHDASFAAYTARWTVAMRDATIVASGRTSEAMDAANLGKIFGVTFGESVVPSPFSRTAMF